MVKIKSCPSLPQKMYLSRTKIKSLSGEDWTSPAALCYSRVSENGDSSIMHGFIIDGCHYVTLQGLGFGKVKQGISLVAASTITNKLSLFLIQRPHVFCGVCVRERERERKCKMLYVYKCVHTAYIHTVAV